jgi:hypothetical protein
MSDRVNALIIGPGNIGTDLLYKALRSPSLRPVWSVGVVEASEGLAIARGHGLRTSHQGLDAALPHLVADGVQIAFDATSADLHAGHNEKLAALGHERGHGRNLGRVSGGRSGEGEAADDADPWHGWNCAHLIFPPSSCQERLRFRTGSGGAGESNVARDQAGAIAEQVLSALLGYHLGGGRYLRLADSPGPEYDAGYCHLPLAFSNAATFKGQP